MDLRIPGLIAKLSGLKGKPFRNSILVAVSTVEEVRAIERQLCAAWKKEHASSAKHSIKKSLDAALWQCKKLTNSLVELS